MVKIKVCTKKYQIPTSKFNPDTKYLYKGYIKVYEDKKYLWSKFSEVKRLYPEDAVNDACVLREETMLQNQID